MGDITDDRIDERIGEMLDTLQPRTRQRAGYKSSHIAKNYEKLERAHRLGWSYKDLAELLTKEGRPTKPATLKYNMRKIAAQRQEQTEKTETPIKQASRKDRSEPETITADTRGMSDEIHKVAAGTIKRFKR